MAFFSGDCAPTELLCQMADGNDLSGLYAARNHYFVTQWLGVREDYADHRSRHHLSRHPAVVTSEHHLVIVNTKHHSDQCLDTPTLKFSEPLM
jgi:hypothetical protein